MYKRKTIDVWDIQGKYSEGWEVVTAETSSREARGAIRTYRENEPGVEFRIRKTREKD